MSEIILEGVLFVALVAAVGTLFYLVVLYFTPVGVRLRQTRNRRRIDRAADLVCPIHGPRAATDLVRLASGETLCPDCYKEIAHG
jgi:hypothetical protein